VKIFNFLTIYNVEAKSTRYLWFIASPFLKRINIKISYKIVSKKKENSTKFAKLPVIYFINVMLH